MSNRSRHHKKLDRDGVRKPRSRDGGEGSGPKGKRPGPLSLGSEDIAGLLSLGTEDRVEAIRELQGRFGNRRVSAALDSSPRSSAPDAGAATPSEPLAAARDDESKDDLDRVPDEVSRRIAGERGGGSSLEQGTRQDMETALGHDFAGVQVHTGPAADDLNRELSATAFTTGEDVFFRDGAYAPGSRDGRELLAHELTHVVQQSGPLPEPRGGITSPDDATEVEAARVGEAVARQPEEEEDIMPVARQPEEEEEIMPVARQPEEEEEIMAVARQPEEEEELMTAARQPEEEEEIMAVARSLDKDAVLRQDSDDESDEKTRLLSALDDIPDEEFIDVGVSSKDEEDPSADAEAKQLATDVGAELGVLKGKESLAAMFVGLLPEESEDDAPLLESPAVDEQLRQGKLTRWLKGAWGFLTKAGSAAGGGIVTGPAVAVVETAGAVKAGRAADALAEVADQAERGGHSDMAGAVRYAAGQKRKKAKRHAVGAVGSAVGVVGAGLLLASNPVGWAVSAVGVATAGSVVAHKAYRRFFKENRGELRRRLAEELHQGLLNRDPVAEAAVRELGLDPEVAEEPRGYTLIFDALKSS